MDRSLLLKKYISLVVAVPALLVALAAWGCNSGEKQVLIRYKLEPGLELSYRLSLEGPTKEYVNDSLRESWQVNATEDYTTTVRRVLEDGTAESRFTGKWRSTRRRLDDPALADSVITRESPAPEILIYSKPNGKMVDLELISDTSQAEEAYLRHHFEQSYPIFPDNPVGPGYSWTQSNKVILPDGPTNATATYTIKGYDRVDGYDCVVIEYDNLAIIPLMAHRSMSGDLISGVHRIRSVGRLDFAYKEGLEVRYKERWTLDADFRFKPEAKPDTLDFKQLIEYDADIALLGVKRP